MMTNKKNNRVENPTEIRVSFTQDDRRSSEYLDMVSPQSSTAYVPRRKNFLIKVYVILMIQFVINVVLCLLSICIEDVKKFMIEHNWTGIISLVFLSATVLAMLLRQEKFKLPLSIICLVFIGVFGNKPIEIMAAKHDYLPIVSSLGITFAIILVATVLAAVIPCHVDSRTLTYIFTTIIIAVTTSTISMIACFVKYKIVHLIFSSVTALAGSVYYFLVSQFVIKYMYIEPADWIFANLALYTAIPIFLIHIGSVLINVIPHRTV